MTTLKTLRKRHERHCIISPALEKCRDAFEYSSIPQLHRILDAAAKARSCGESIWYWYQNLPNWKGGCATTREQQETQRAAMEQELSCAELMHLIAYLSLEIVYRQQAVYDKWEGK